MADALADALDLPADGTDDFELLEHTLTQAAQHGDVETLRLLGVHVIDHVHPLLVHVALERRQADVLAWLVDESERTGVDIANGWQRVHLAAYQGRTDKLELTSDEDLAQTTTHGATVLHAALLGDQGDVIEYLVRERGVDVRAVDPLGRTSLERAAQAGCLAAIDALVACGARLHVARGEPCKALVQAAEYGQVDAMEKLVELGADIGVVREWGSVLHVAVSCGLVAVIDCAVRLGAPVRAVDRRGRTPLHAAAVHDQPGVLRRLAQLRVRIDAVDVEGLTALHWAARSPRACRALLELGADRCIKNNDGHTALDHAINVADPEDDEAAQVMELLATYFPIVPSLVQLLLGLRGPGQSSLTRFAAHSAFEPNVLSLVNCLLTGKDDTAFHQLLDEC